MDKYYKEILIDFANLMNDEVLTIFDIVGAYDNTLERACKHDEKLKEIFQTLENHIKSYKEATNV